MTKVIWCTFKAYFLTLEDNEIYAQVTRNEMTYPFVTHFEVKKFS